MPRSLKISKIVFGRINVDGRVRYLVDPKGQGTDRRIPEEVVLYRWKTRKHKYLSFYGDRLNPHVWRHMAVALGPDVAKWLTYTLDELKHLRDAQVKSTLPQPLNMHALIHMCGVERLQRIVERHCNSAAEVQFGVPDLFLYAKRKADGGYSRCHFVEVKKPKEPLSQEQRDEIAFMHSLGFDASTFVFIER